MEKLFYNDNPIGKQTKFIIFQTYFQFIDTIPSTSTVKRLPKDQKRTFHRISYLNYHQRTVGTEKRGSRTDKAEKTEKIALEGKQKENENMTSFGIFFVL